MAETNGYETSIEEARSQLNRQFESVDALREIARTLLSSASLVFAFLGVFQLVFTPSKPPYTVWHGFVLSAIVALYVSLVVICVVVVSPAGMNGPIEPTWETLYSAFVSRSGVELLRMQLSAYLNAIALNDKTISRRQRLTVIAGALLPAISVLLAVLGMISHLGQ